MASKQTHIDRIRDAAERVKNELSAITNSPALPRITRLDIDVFEQRGHEALTEAAHNARVVCSEREPGA